MKHGSLFSGIGGFDLAAEWMGWDNVFHCEWNEFGKKVLKYYWPESISYDDITKTDFTIHRGGIDILTGGFPCQPYSTAGKRLGKEDDRHLWPEMLRAIREVRPRWVVGENVFGLINWNGGLVFHEVQADLEAEGYEVWPYVLPAVSVNAPHRRDRVWFVAKNTSSDGCVQREPIQKGTEVRKQRDTCTGGGNGFYIQQGNVANTNSNGFNGGNCKDEKHTGKRGFDALCNIEQGSKYGASPDPESQQGEWVRPEQRELSQQEQGKSGGSCCGMGDGTTSNTGLFRSQKRQQQSVGVDQLCEKRDAADPNTSGCKDRPEQHRGQQASPGEGQHSTYGCGTRIDRNQEYYYKCKCGYEFEEELGKYGCPNCCGEYTARLTPNTNFTGRGEECQPPTQPGEQKRQHRETHIGSRPLGWERFPTTQPTIRTGNDGPAPKLDSITFSKWRNESIKAAGNAVVVPLVYQIFKAIQAYENG